MNFKFTVLAILSVIFFTLCQYGYGEEKKQLKLVLDQMVKVLDGVHVVKTELIFDSNEAVISGTLETLVDLDNDYKLSFDILHSPVKDLEMKMVIRIADKGVCEILSNQYKKYLYETMKNYGSVPDTDLCPAPIKKFEIKNYPLDSSQFSKYLRPGFYHIVTTMRHNDEEILQYRTEGHTEEV